MDFMTKKAKMTTSPPVVFNIAEAKSNFSEIVGRVAFGGEVVLITRRGRPMARIVPVEQPSRDRPFAEARGWMDDDDPFLESVKGIVEARSTHKPRSASASTPRRVRGGPPRR